MPRMGNSRPSPNHLSCPFAGRRCNRESLRGLSESGSSSIRDSSAGVCWWGFTLPPPLLTPIAIIDLRHFAFVNTFDVDIPLRHIRRHRPAESSTQLEIRKLVAPVRRGTMSQKVWIDSLPKRLPPDAPYHASNRAQRNNNEWCVKILCMQRPHLVREKAETGAPPAIVAAISLFRPWAAPHSYAWSLTGVSRP